MSADLLTIDTRQGITTLTMNQPDRLNGWSTPMTDSIRAALADAATDDATRVVILTGVGPYYCAGVNLGGAAKLMHPREMHEYIVSSNSALFGMFIDFPKPILVAVNGPALGASVTSAVLCDGIVASEKASFSTPFAELGAVPEGCSSVTFPRLLGQAVAERMLGDEGWKPTGTEAKSIGLVEWVVPPDELMEKARSIAAGWIETGARRTFRGGFTREELERVNAIESQALATAFMAPKFLKGRFRFYWRKKKWSTALTFLAMWITRPLWSRMM